MNSLLILSHPQNLSHLAIIINKNDKLKEFLKDAKSFKSNFHQILALENPSFYTSIGEKPDFKELILKNNISLILTCNEEKDSISFSLKEDEDFREYDYKDFIKEYGEEDFKNLLALNDEKESIMQSKEDKKNNIEKPELIQSLERLINNKEESLQLAKIELENLEQEIKELEPQLILVNNPRYEEAKRKLDIDEEDNLYNHLRVAENKVYYLEKDLNDLKEKLNSFSKIKEILEQNNSVDIDRALKEIELLKQELINDQALKDTGFDYYNYPPLFKDMFSKAYLNLLERLREDGLDMFDIMANDTRKDIYPLLYNEIKNIHQINQGENNVSNSKSSTKPTTNDENTTNKLGGGNFTNSDTNSHTRESIQEDNREDREFTSSPPLQNTPNESSSTLQVLSANNQPTEEDELRDTLRGDGRLESGSRLDDERNDFTQGGGNSNPTSENEREKRANLQGDTNTQEQTNLSGLSLRNDASKYELFRTRIRALLQGKLAKETLTQSMRTSLREFRAKLQEPRNNEVFRANERSSRAFGGGNSYPEAERGGAGGGAGGGVRGSKSEEGTNSLHNREFGGGVGESSPNFMGGESEGSQDESRIRNQLNDNTLNEPKFQSEGNILKDEGSEGFNSDELFNQLPPHTEPSSKGNEFIAENQGREFDEPSIKGNDESSLTSTREERNDEGGEANKQDNPLSNGISTRPNESKNEENPPLSQSKTELREFQKSPIDEQGGVRVELNNDEKESELKNQGSFNKEDEATLHNLANAITKKALEEFKKDDEAYEKASQTLFELEESSFLTFSQLDLLKKLDGQNYKGEVDFKLTLKERIKANYEALTLMQDILKSGRLTATKEEQSILAKFSGYGGLKKLFYDESFSEDKDKLLALVGFKHFNSLRESAETAFYTPSFIIEAMIERLYKLGVSKNERLKVLEPSCGVGRFMSRSPLNFEFEAVELDNLSASIAKLLHPRVIIHNKPFEEVKFQKEFDLVIGNPPFSKESVYDLSSQGHNQSLHNYFAIKSVELLKENGILSFIISSHFLDSTKDKHRLIMSNNGGLIDAYRLSSSAFDNTSVISDMIFYAKGKFNEDKMRSYDVPRGLRRAFSGFNDTGILYGLDDVGKELRYSSVFEEGENILGKLSIGTNQFGSTLNLKSTQEELKESIREKIIDESFVYQIFKNNPPYEAKESELLNLDGLSSEERNNIFKLKNGNTFIKDNKLYIKENDFYMREAFFEDTLPIEKKYLIDSSLYINVGTKKNSKNFTYKSYLNDEELHIASKICELRDKLQFHIYSEKIMDNSKESNELLMKQKNELKELREEILSLSKVKAFNATMQNKKDEEGKIIKHSLKDILALDCLSAYEILALENKEGKDYVLSSILNERVHKPYEKVLANNEEEALLKTLSEKGKIDLATLQSYMPDKELEQILYPLLEKRLIFHSLESPQENMLNTELFTQDETKFKGQYELAESFLSGNVKKKHAHIKMMIEKGENFEGLSLSLNEVATELEKAFPNYVNYEDISINFGASYIDKEIYENFIKDTFCDKENVSISVNLLDSFYTISPLYIQDNEGRLSELSDDELNREAIDSFTIRKEDNSVAFNYLSFIERVMNNKSLEVYHHEDDPNETLDKNGKVRKVKITESVPTKLALEKKEELCERFESYLLNKPLFRERIEKSYNDTINCYTFNKNSYAKFFSSPELSLNKIPREHQKSVAFKGIMQNSLLLDHQVGAGKTLAGICIIMEQLRMKLIRKALILVPNHLTNQWASEIKEAYPKANILVGDKLDNKKDRKEFLHRIKYGNNEVVVMKHSTFENLSVLESYERGVYYDYIKHIEEETERIIRENKTLKSGDIAKIRECADKKIKRLSKKLEKKAKGKKYDDELAFEDLGFDCVMVDEAHHFKNLLIDTNQENIKGLSNTDSAKAMKMYCVSKFLHENNYKFYFLTGTPVSNSIAEFFVMQKYLQPQLLEDLKLSHFDAWQRAFTQIVDSEELDSSGINYKIVSRLSKFINAPELMNLYLQNADVISIEEVEKLTGKLTPNLKGGKVINVIAPRSEDIANYIGIENDKGEYNRGSIIYRMDHLREDPRENNMLKCTSDARKAALDFRLIDNNASDYEDSKINHMCDRVFAHYNDENYPNNTQLIFCDMGVSKKTSQSIDINDNNTSAFLNLEQMAKEMNLVLERDEESEESYYVKYELYDKEGKKLEKPKFIKRYEIEELLELAGDKFDVYADILKKLCQKGIKQEEIAFIGDASNDKQKQALFDRVNRGEIRVLIGSTMKMGAGTNVQKKVIALHELDCPWRPCDLEQRQGRVIRQGNEWFEKDKEFCIFHYRYSTEQTYDARMFQVNEQKLKPLIQLKKCDFSKGQRSFDSIDSELASVAEMKAYATGNPFILEKHKITSMLKSEERHYESYKKSLLQSERDLNTLKARKNRLEEDLKALGEMVNCKEFEKENYEIEAFGIKINKKMPKKDAKNEATFKKLEEEYKKNKNLINEHIKKAFLNNDGEEVELFKANGISVRVKATYEFGGGLYYKGIMSFGKDIEYTPANLIFKSEGNNVFYHYPAIDGLLERVKNNFAKSRESLNKISEVLKNTQRELKRNEEYIKNNDINVYPRKVLLDTLKQDERNINEIFTIRNRLRKEGIKIDMNSKEIKHLLPNYPKLIDEKGRFKGNNDELLKQNSQPDIIITNRGNVKNLILENNVEIKLDDPKEKENLEAKVQTLLANQENIHKASRVRDILR